MKCSAGTVARVINLTLLTGLDDEYIISHYYIRKCLHIILNSWKNLHSL